MSRNPRHAQEKNAGSARRAQKINSIKTNCYLFRAVACFRKIRVYVCRVPSSRIQQWVSSQTGNLKPDN